MFFISDAPNFYIHLGWLKVKELTYVLYSLAGVNRMFVLFSELCPLNSEIKNL